MNKAVIYLLILLLLGGGTYLVVNRGEEEEAVVNDNDEKRREEVMSSEEMAKKIHKIIDEYELELAQYYDNPRLLERRILEIARVEFGAEVDPRELREMISDIVEEMELD